MSPHVSPHLLPYLRPHQLPHLYPKFVLQLRPQINTFIHMRPTSRLLLSSSTPSGLHTLPLRHKEHIATPCQIMPCVAFPSYPAKLSQFLLGDAVRQSTRWRFLYIVYYVLDIVLCKWPATGALLVHLTCYVCVFPCLIRVALDTFDFGRRSNLGASTLLLTDQLADACVPAP